MYKPAVPVNPGTTFLTSMAKEKRKDRLEQLVDAMNDYEKKRVYKLLSDHFKVPVEKHAPGRNKTAGHDYEREVRRLLIEAGFTHVITTRQGSRHRDSQGIDFMNADEHIHGRLPYNIQAKNYVGRISYDEVLGRLPSVPEVINVIFHKMTRRPSSGKAIFMPVGHYAILYKTDFIRMMKSILELKRQVDGTKKDTAY